MELDDPTLLLLHEEVGESYDAVARSAARAVGAEACHLALYDAESDEMIAQRPRYQAPGLAVPRFRFRLDSSPASSHVVRTGEPYLTNDPANDPLYHPSAGEKGLRSVLTVPVQREGRVLGLVYALNKPDGFTTEDARTLTALAAAFAVTLENIRLYTKEREKRVLNESLWEMSRALIAHLPDNGELGAVLEQMGRVVVYRAAAALVREGDRLRVVASRGGKAGIELPVGSSGELAEVLAGRPMQSLSDGALLATLGIRAEGGEALTAPLAGKGEVLGALVVAFDPDHPPVRRDRQLVQAFADHAAVFLGAGRQARARAAALARISRTMAGPQEAEPPLLSVAPEILGASGCDRVALYVKHPSAALLVPAAQAGAAHEELLGFWGLRLELESEDLAPLAGRMPVFFDAESGALPAAIVPFPTVRSLVVLPLVFRDELLGAMGAGRTSCAHRFDPGLVAFLRDVAQQVALGMGHARLFAALTQMAVTDELTQLANRRRFGEVLRHELARSRRTGAPIALILADIDHLKIINDTHGHLTGDAAIRHVAEAFQRGRREIDVAARLGGEEFALLLPGTDRLGAIRAAERIRGELAGSGLPAVGAVTVSLGVATCPEDGTAEEDLLAVADERLYSAKSAGRNRSVI